MLTKTTIVFLLLTSCLASLLEGAPVVDSGVKESCHSALSAGLAKFGMGGVRHFKRRPTPFATTDNKEAAFVVEPVKQQVKATVAEEKQDLVDIGQGLNDVAIVDGGLKEEEKQNPKSNLLADYHLEEKVDTEPVKPSTGSSLENDYLLNGDIKPVEVKAVATDKPASPIFQSDAVALSEQKEEVDPDIQKKLKIMLSNEDIKDEEEYEDEDEEKEEEEQIKPVAVSSLSNKLDEDHTHNSDDLIGLASISNLIDRQ